MKLQINTSGAWRNVVEFDAARKAEVVRAARILGGILGDSASWSIVRDDGKREWLGDVEPPSIEINIEHIGRCEVPVRGAVAYMPDVTVRDIVSKACRGD